METQVRYCLGNLNVFNDSLSCVGAPLPAISFYFESERAFYFNDFYWLSVINLCHSLNLNELHKVAYLVGVAFIFMHSDHSLFILRNGHNNKRLSSFTIVVCHNMAISVV